MSLIRPYSGGKPAEMWDTFSQKPPRPFWKWLDFDNPNIVHISELGEYDNPKPTNKNRSPLLVVCDEPEWIALAKDEVYSCDANGHVFCVKPKLRTISVYQVDERGALLRSPTAQVELPWRDSAGREKSLESIALLSEGKPIPKSATFLPDKPAVENNDSVIPTTEQTNLNQREEIIMAESNVTEAMREAFGEQYGEETANAPSDMNLFNEEKTETGENAASAEGTPTPQDGNLEESDEVKKAAKEARKKDNETKKQIAEDLTKELLSNVANAPATDKASPGLIAGMIRSARIIGFVTPTAAKTSYRVVSKIVSVGGTSATKADKAKGSKSTSVKVTKYIPKFVNSRPGAATHTIAEIPQRLEAATVDMLMTDSVIKDTAQWADPLVAIPTVKIVAPKEEFNRFLGACVGFSPIKEHDVTAAGGTPSMYALVQSVVVGDGGPAAGDNVLTRKKSTIKVTLKRVSGTNGKALVHTRNYFPMTTYKTFNHATEPQEGEALSALEFGEFRGYFKTRKATDKKPAHRAVDSWPPEVLSKIRIDENQEITSDVYTGKDYSEKLEKYFDGTPADVTRIPVRTRIKADGTRGESALFFRIPTADINRTDPDSAWLDPMFEKIREAAGVTLLEASVKQISASKANTRGKSIVATPEATSTLFRKAAPNVQITFA